MEWNVVHCHGQVLEVALLLLIRIMIPIIPSVLWEVDMDGLSASLKDRRDQQHIGPHELRINGIGVRICRIVESKGLDDRTTREVSVVHQRIQHRKQ